ncbi:MAG: hypothetical protein A3H35_18775 [Betaproteobacteria bacterium RIFCSPLOWO2_02_FULL_62_17]|nr:MAG: hypothetical protein A3H35_18775 [Betaproteobacteria bacterium RIFCSPLOWO2_02_FULL_62_17]
MLEHEAKTLLTAAVMATPNGVLNCPEKAVRASNSLGYPVALKARISAGQRGKAGGVLFAETIAEIASKYNHLIGKTVDSFPVAELLIEREIEILGSPLRIHDGPPADRHGHEDRQANELNDPAAKARNRPSPSPRRANKEETKHG